MVLAGTEIADRDVCCHEISFSPVTDPMKHTQPSETSQRQAVLTPKPTSPTSPPIQRTAIYQLSPAPQDLMTPKTNLPVALEAMSSVWLPPTDARYQRDTALPVIEGPRGPIRAGDHRQKQRYITVVQPPKTGAKRNNGIRSCFSDSFLHTRVEPLDDGLNMAARPFKGLVPASQDQRRPSTPIVDSATKASVNVKRQRFFSSTDSARTLKETRNGVATGRSEPPKKLANRTKNQKATSKAGNARKDPELRDSLKELENGSFCVWKERTRSLRRASETSSGKTDTETPAGDKGTVKAETKEERRRNWKQEFVIKHLNYCSSRKTQQVVQWLREVNLQDSFEIIE
ncbi:uncharacterized protein LOC110977110 [Acanthaster planci]|uniref:Uncharacterized protein LOC110977110 n=1 Tax=Acanthaster planci TaxID=133434 RepID=A0A8B7Y432_ACAPL|nr:uncharacterized protein LOC110977110 [Acanthaster planci]